MQNKNSGGRWKFKGSFIADIEMGLGEGVRAGRSGLSSGLSNGFDGARQKSDELAEPSWEWQWRLNKSGRLELNPDW